jgi:histidyl-tRNA synthetase
MKKQMTYANNTKAHFVAMVGENEMIENKITLKNMQTGEQQTVSLEKAIEAILKK